MNKRDDSQAGSSVFCEEPRSNAAGGQKLAKEKGEGRLGKKAGLDCGRVEGP